MTKVIVFGYLLFYLANNLNGFALINKRKQIETYISKMFGSGKDSVYFSSGDFFFFSFFLPFFFLFFFGKVDL